MSIATVRTFNGADFSGNSLGKFITPIEPYIDGLIAASVFGGSLVASLAPISDGRPFEVATGSATPSSKDMTMQGVVRLNPSAAFGGNLTIMSVIKTSISRDSIIGGGLGVATFQMLGQKNDGKIVAISQVNSVPQTAEVTLAPGQEYEFVAAVFNKDQGTVSLYVPRINQWMQITAPVAASGSAAYRICSYAIDVSVAFSGPNTQAFHSLNSVAIPRDGIDATYTSVRTFVSSRGLII